MFNFELALAITSIILVTGVGYLAKRLNVLEIEHGKILNNVVLYLALPAFVFRAVYQANMNENIYFIPLIAVLTTGSMVSVAYVLARLFKLGSELTGSFILASGVGNTGYLAYPVLLAVFGNKGLVRGIFYDMFGLVIFMFTAGIYISSYYGKSEEKTSVLKQFLLFPPLYGLLLGFLLRPFVVPEVIMQSLNILSGITIGLILISIGIVLEPSHGIKKYLKLISVSIILKLIISPILVFGLGFIFGLDMLSRTTTVLSASMPTAVMTLVFGIKYELDVDYLSSAVFILTILSVVTVPVMQLILTAA